MFFTLTNLKKKVPNHSPEHLLLGENWHLLLEIWAKVKKNLRLSYLLAVISTVWSREIFLEAEPPFLRGESTANKSTSRFYHIKVGLPLDSINLRGSASRIHQHTAQKWGPLCVDNFIGLYRTYKSLDHQIRLYVYLIWAGSGLRNPRNCITYLNFVTWMILIIKFWLKKWKICNLSKIQTKHAVNFVIILTRKTLLI